MNKEAQRIAIAEACGWKPTSADFWINPDGKLWSNIPDYLNDLNAMAVAEKVLNNAQYSYYITHLEIIVRDSAGERSNTRYPHSATAYQRAEAFLRTLGLWKDETP